MKGMPFTADMAQAFIARRKGVTRRLFDAQPDPTVESIVELPALDPVLKCVVPGSTGVWEDEHSMDEVYRCRYRAGEVCCMLTTWAVPVSFDDLRGKEFDGGGIQLWHAGLGPKPTWAGKNRPGRFLPDTMRHLMPLVKIVHVRPERLQAITEVEARLEGLESHGSGPLRRYGLSTWYAEEWQTTARDAFRVLINKIHGADTWEKNQWVWRIKIDRA